MPINPEPHELMEIAFLRYAYITVFMMIFVILLVGLLGTVVMEETASIRRAIRENKPVRVQPQPVSPHQSRPPE